MRRVVALGGDVSFARKPGGLLVEIPLWPWRTCTLSEDLQQQLRQIGKGLQQLHIKLGRLTETVEARAVVSGGSGGAVGASGGDEVLLGCLFDLIDGVEMALGGAAPGNPHWNGLRICRDQALARLADMGVTPAPVVGAHDPTLHQVIEVQEAPSPSLHGQIARTFRKGWLRRLATSQNPQLVRTAHVSVYFNKEPLGG